MANENLTMDDAVDMAVDLATTQGGKPIVEDAPLEETPANAPEAAEKPAEAAEVEPEEETSSDELATQLAELTHDNVVHTKAGKGLVSELHRERAKRQELEAKLDAINATKDEPKDEFEPETEDEDVDDDDNDIFTAADVKKIVSRELAKALKPVAERNARTDKAERQQVMSAGLAALAARQKAGDIPVGVNTTSIVNKAVEALGASRPALLQELLSDPDPVGAVFEYATARMPEAKQALAKATKTTADVHAERLAKGQHPETGGEPAEISDFIAELNSP